MFILCMIISPTNSIPNAQLFKPMNDQFTSVQSAAFCLILPDIMIVIGTYSNIDIRPMCKC